MATAPAGQRRSGLFATKDTDALVRDTEAKGESLQRVVGLLDLTALGLGAIIGTGIFVVIGEAIGDSGPAIILSFLLAGVTCAFSALAFAELASTIPVAGSAYTYSYATLGELIAWIIGWDLILEYAVSVAAIAVGWGQYFNDLADSLFGFKLPSALANPPGAGGSFNLPAVFIVLAVAALLMYGVRESARTNTVMVITKLSIVVIFIVLAFTGFNADNLHPFAPNGFSGIVDGAAIVFFAYIGFDAISTSGEETKNPGRDMPIAIVSALAICTVLYILVALSAVAAVPYKKINEQAPLAGIMRTLNFDFAATLISFGALVAITSVVLTILYGQTRIMFAMSRDGLVPRRLGRLHPTRHTPVFITGMFALLICIPAAFVPLSEIAKLVNIGTLFAFVITNAGVIVLRRTRPDLDRSFRVPFVPVFPIIGILLAVYLMTRLEAATWWRFGIWLVIGLVIYFAYGRTHSALRRGEVANPEAQLD